VRLSVLLLNSLKPKPYHICQFRVMFTCHTILHASCAFNSKSSHKLSQHSSCSVPNDCAGVEELNVATIYMRVFQILTCSNFSCMDVIEGSTLHFIALPKFLSTGFAHWALPTLLVTVNFFWALPTLLGAVNFLGTTYSPGCCVFHSVLPKFATKFLAEMKFA
jgi:hypothetical protein